MNTRYCSACLEQFLKNIKCKKKIKNCAVKKVLLFSKLVCIAIILVKLLEKINVHIEDIKIENKKQKAFKNPFFSQPLNHVR